MKYVGVSGLVVTKLDGTARGGFIVSVVKELGIPVKLIGVGEKITDLRDFSPESFVDALLGALEYLFLYMSPLHNGWCLGTDPSKAEVLKSKANKIFNIVPVEQLQANLNAASSTASDPSLRLKAMFDQEEESAQVVAASSGKSKRKPRPKRSKK